MDALELQRYIASAFKNETVLKKSSRCVCYYCRSTYTPENISEWIEEDSSGVRTALCPECELDSVLGDAMQLDLSDDKIELVSKRAFNRS